jgi:hypothetical protein
MNSLVRELKDLAIGETFKVAEASVKTKNNLILMNNDILVIKKRFAVSPYFVMCTKIGTEEPFYVLPPETLVFPPRLANAVLSKDHVDFFSKKKKTRRIALGYRLCYNGDMAETSGLSRKEKKLIHLLFAYGLKEFKACDVVPIVAKHKEIYTGNAPDNITYVLLMRLVKKQLLEKIYSGPVEE